jgi:hypothetical protein
MTNVFIALGIAIAAGLIMSFATTMTILFYRKQIGKTGWSMSITTGVWAILVLLVIFAQDIVSPRIAAVAVPSLVAALTVVAIGYGVRLLKRAGGVL